MRVGRRIAALLVAGLALAAFSRDARGDLPEIQKRGSLRVLVMTGAGPDEFFSSLPAGPPGFDRELLEQFADLRKLNLEIVPVSSWDGLVPALREGRGDLIAGRFTATETRRKLVDFTLEVFPTRDVVVTRRPHRVVATLEELRQERVGTVKGTSLAEAVSAAGVPATSVDDRIPSGGLPAALKQGAVDAVVLGIESAVSARRADPDLQIGLFLGRPGSLAWAVRKTDGALLGALNGYLQNVQRTTTWSRLVVKYFGEDALEVLRKARAE
jgi:membrane-bound lytic murein transglycosylase F